MFILCFVSMLDSVFPNLSTIDEFFLSISWNIATISSTKTNLISGADLFTYSYLSLNGKVAIYIWVNIKSKLKILKEVPTKIGFVQIFN